MFSLTNMPSTSSVLSTYTTFAASTMLARTMLSEVQAMTKQLIPPQLQEKILLKLRRFIGNFSSHLTLVIEEYNGLFKNEIYQASESYLRTKITPSIEQLKVSKAPREKNMSVTINKGQKIIDEFEGIKLTWELVCCETQKQSIDYEGNSISMEKIEHKSIELSFHKKYKEMVLGSYLPYVVKRAKGIKEENKEVKLYSRGPFYGDYNANGWGSINLDHPSTFDTLAMDPTVKKDLINDLDRFVRRREFYRRVGKAWKRGYLLYGPPGSGKSSLIAAMANYLKFDIYDLKLTSIQNNSELRRLLVSTTNRSILVIEDIDCSVEFQDRNYGTHNRGDNQLTLSGLLNFIDGLWSSCGDERIIVFTTNHKDRLDPALLRPGRMDKHIHMSYCTPGAFKTLASNYLGTSSHYKLTEIEELIGEVEVTPAEIAEELMKNEDVDIVIEGLNEFLQRKKMKFTEPMVEMGNKVAEQARESGEIVEDDEKRVHKNKRKA